MGAVRLLNREEMERKLTPYGGRLVMPVAPNVELWETGWKFGFTLQTIYDDKYSEIQLPKVLQRILESMPPGWGE